MAKDDRTKKDDEAAKKKLYNDVGRYFFNKQSQKSGKAQSRLEKIDMLLSVMGLDLRDVAAENSEMAGALRTLMDEKKKWFQFLNKDVRNKLYERILDGAVEAIEKKSRTSEEVTSRLLSHLEHEGQAQKNSKNLRPIDRLNSLNHALKATNKNILKNYFKNDQNESPGAKAMNVFYRSKIIRIILGLGTDRDMYSVQEKIKQVNAKTYASTVQEIKTKQQKEMPVFRVTNTPKFETAEIRHTEAEGTKAVVQMMKRPKVYKATSHKVEERQVKPEQNTSQTKVMPQKTKVPPGTPLEGIRKDTRDRADHKLIFSTATLHTLPPKPVESSSKENKEGLDINPSGERPHR